jgi:hypothetical protein
MLAYLRRRVYMECTLDVQTMQKCFMSKLYFIRETTLFLQGCTIFTVFVKRHICFEPLKNLIFQILSTNYKYKTFWRWKLYSFSFVYTL